MLIKIDENKCLGCGLFLSIAPYVFELGEDGKSKIKEGAYLEKTKS